MWIFLLSFSAVDAHTGYEFPWSPLGITDLFFSTSEYHDFHHSHNVGNYGAILVHWDFVFKTN